MSSASFKSTQGDWCELAISGSWEGDRDRLPSDGDTQNKHFDLSSSCFGDHSATIPVTTLVIVKQVLKIYGFYFKFHKYFTYCI